MAGLRSLPVRPPVSPMLAKLVRELPVGDDLLYEPKWDGFRCIVFRSGDEVELGSRNERPLTRYFPELVESLKKALPERVVVDGEIVIATDHGLDFDQLSLRIHPAASRIKKLSEEIPSSFVAFDLLAEGDEDWRGQPFAKRRRRLEQLLRKAKPPVHLTPATDNPDVANDWFSRFEGAGLDGVLAKPGRETYHEGQRTMMKVKHLRTADCVVAGYRQHKDGAGVGSLLLGLYDDHGDLHHVGVAASFAAPLRKQLAREVAPYRKDALRDHPWREWAAADMDTTQRMPGGLSRWNAGKDLSWEPLRIELVAEVAYEHLQGDRFRHTARFVRWRPDRDPSSCTYEQLESPVPIELHEVFGV
ncbi:MAG: ATP-dependent DNA ligase [Actinobacteria bacterium]|nr:MAG: ATP-dependent DNA ligase [Actinomycetota bacterium]